MKRLAIETLGLMAGYCATTDRQLSSRIFV